jgi:hypothetical protein
LPLDGDGYGASKWRISYDERYVEILFIIIIEKRHFLKLRNVCVSNIKVIYYNYHGDLTKRHNSDNSWRKLSFEE